jgi:hypothetical protein
MKMSRVHREQLGHRYIHAEAILKHLFAVQASRLSRVPENECFVARLIEHVNRSLNEKWRSYAQTRNRRLDGTTRVDVA